VQRDALNTALGECDNPYFWPLTIVAKETTLRRDTLLKMQWSLVDLENRTMMLPTKTGQMSYSISTPVLEVLSHLPHDPSGFVFPMTPNSVTLAWNRVRERANLPNLQFKDLRHLGATDWVRRGLKTHELKHVLGHSTITTAQFYVDLVGEDQLRALDLATARSAAVELPPSSPKDAQTQRNEKRAQRLNRPKAEQGDLADKNGVMPSRTTDSPGASPDQLGETLALVSATAVAPALEDATSVFLREHGQTVAPECAKRQETVSNIIAFRFRKAA
jgi:hypothetical protein